MRDGLIAENPARAFHYPRPKKVSANVLTPTEVEDYLDAAERLGYTKENIRGEYASLDNFIRQWSAQEKKEEIRDLLRERGIDLELLKADQGMADVDDFDFICHVAFDKKPLTRKERANNVKKRDFFSKYSGVAREVLEALLDKYMNTGIYEIEKTEILKLDPFLKLGKPAKIAGYFGGKQGYLKAVQELEQAIYMDEVI